MLDLKNILTVDAILELTNSDIGDFWDDLLDADILIEIIENEYGDRKQFCEYLGIGESTLTGWIKDDRIPRMAKLAYGLRRMLNLLSAELQKDRNGLTIVKAKNGYQICKFEEDNDGVLIGHALAEGIENIKIARLLASSILTLEFLNQAKSIINDKIDSLDGYFPTNHLEDLRNNITNSTLFVTNYEEWQSLYGKKHRKFLPDADLSTLDIGQHSKQRDTLAESHSSLEKYEISIKGSKYHSSSYGEILHILLTELHKQDPHFLQKLYQEKTRGEARIVAKTGSSDELYPRSGSKHSQKEQECHVADNFIMTKCISSEQFDNRMGIACKVAGLRNGVDVIFKEIYKDIYKNLTLEDLGL